MAQDGPTVSTARVVLGVAVRHVSRPGVRRGRRDTDPSVAANLLRQVTTAGPAKVVRVENDVRVD